MGGGGGEAVDRRTRGQADTRDRLTGGQADPDLTYSLSDEGGVTADSFAVLVRRGSSDGQMKGFEELLDDPLIESIYAYVKARSDGELAPGRPHQAPASE